MKKREKGKRGKGLSRRDFLKEGGKLAVAASALGTGMLFKVPPARAAKSLQGTGEVVVCGWGGAFQDAMKETMFEPFTKETGIKVIDTSTPDSAQVKAQVDSKNVEWDLANLSYQDGIILGESYWEKLDYSYFDDADLKGISAVARTPISCAGYFFSYIIAYNEKKYAGENHPKSWADFVDSQKFPGKRTFPGIGGGGHVHCEEAQMGMGVAKDKLYPPDTKKVWAFYDKLKPHCIKWWSMGAEAPQLLVDGEVDIASAYSGRIQQLIDKDLPFKIEWNQGVMSENGWLVLKGAKNLTNAMKFIAFASRAEIQAALAAKIPYGPSNLRAFEFIKPDLRAKLNTAPEIFDKQVVINWDWYIKKTLDPAGKIENREYLANEFQSWVLK